MQRSLSHHFKGVFQTLKHWHCCLCLSLLIEKASQSAGLRRHAKQKRGRTGSGRKGTRHSAAHKQWENVFDDVDEAIAEDVFLKKQPKERQDSRVGSTELLCNDFCE